jgi:hypothetical protein
MGNGKAEMENGKWKMRTRGEGCEQDGENDEIRMTNDE